MKSVILLSMLGLALRAMGQPTSNAQRPDDESICDYYARQRYGKSNSTSQYLLMSSIVALAYAGGNDLHAQGANDTGIFNKGSYHGNDVYLRSWFDGTKATTNFNNQAIGVNWLDGGGVEPLQAYLNGSLKSLNLDKDSNQYRLFTHWFTSFGGIYGCTEIQSFPKAESGSGSSGGGKLPPAYVHKYMDLNQTQVGYFIEQLTAASKHFGFSDSDAQTLDVTMNARYNNRCAPPGDDGQLNSICLNDDCPLAQPTADCKLYEDITASSGGSSSNSSSSSSPSSTSAAPKSSATNPTSSSSSQSSSGLSGGQIAGIVIGCVAIALIAAGMFLFFRRRKLSEGQNSTSSSGRAMNSHMAHCGLGSPPGIFVHTAPPSAHSHSPHPASMRGQPHHGSLQSEANQHGYEGVWQSQSPRQQQQQPVEVHGDSVHGGSVHGGSIRGATVDSPTFSHAWQPNADIQGRQSPTVPRQFTPTSYGGYMGG